ncbi:MAG TPA: ATP-binding protein [Bryobacteraceae bacterium]|nr:ATP-binding protein [Bryobacteraceae bacterium]
METKDRFELLVSELEEFVIILLDDDGIFQTWHPGVERLFGYTEQEFIGRHMDILVPEPDRSDGATTRELAEAVRVGRSSDTRTLVRKNGQEVFVDGVTVALFNESGKRSGFGKVIRDLTERQQAQQSLLAARDELKRANQHLERMTVELERSNEELREFAHIASHDLSAPLTSTRWLVDLLEMKYSEHLDERGKDCIQRIRRGLDRMSALVDAVLAHAQAGQSPITSSESTPAEEALYKALENLRSEIIASQAQFVHGALPDLLMASEPLCRVFQNLISNAIKYRRPGVPPRIEITAERESASWRIGVCDNGIGIEAQYFERIFIPMQRLHGPEIDGSGIGLATCKKIVGRAGGRLWVESEVEKGSSFYFVLPGE